ncbi:MAG: hypothetical protein CSA62_13870 [Planctomycetota bacterium]|nr:MAG: hypothetical protein CSA62_13870 [Planctomycetota bacterium]
MYLRYNAADRRLYAVDQRSSEIVFAQWQGPGSPLPSVFSRVIGFHQASFSAKRGFIARPPIGVAGVLIIPDGIHGTGTLLATQDGATWKLSGFRSAAGSGRARSVWACRSVEHSISTARLRFEAKGTVMFQVIDSVDASVHYVGAVPADPGYLDVNFQPALTPGRTYLVKDVLLGAIQDSFVPKQRFGDVTASISIQPGRGQLIDRHAKIGSQLFSAGATVTMSSASSTERSLPSQLWVAVAPGGQDPAVVMLPGGGAVLTAPDFIVPFDCLVRSGSTYGSGGAFLPIANDPGLIGTKLCFQVVITDRELNEVAATDVFCTLIGGVTQDGRRVSPPALNKPKRISHEHALRLFKNQATRKVSVHEALGSSKSAVRARKIRKLLLTPGQKKK